MNFVGGIPDGCKAFSNEECDYFGADTGFSTGPHSHFEIRPVGKGAVNPIAYLPPRL